MWPVETSNDVEATSTPPDKAQGYWGMLCWNALSADQQEFLRTKGYLPWGYRPEGECPNGAELEITTMYDEFPGPRFYCRPCAVQWLSQPIKERS